ncbi:zinc finger protein ZXDC [Astyanax mexicanus]|uniref:zinc finger protein ZXDC n=1 Tax=Astyanax mexicanus TaxID=7994 RepID=UPI0020CAB9F7|nr:zinc finger protein ZXDC [Astyanax mexicanus]
MEIQGLTDAQNTHYQHGAPRKSGSPPLGTATGSCVSSFGSKENGSGGRPAQRGLQRDSDSNNNRRPGCSPPCTLVQNGSVGLPRLCLQQDGRDDPPSPRAAGVVELREYGDLELPADFVKVELKYSGEESEEDGVLQMALPLFEGEDGYGEQRPQEEQLQLQQRREDTGCRNGSLSKFNVNSNAIVSLSSSLSTSTSFTATASSSSSSNNNSSGGSSSSASATPSSSASTAGSSGGKGREEFYVVFNIVPDENGLDKERRTRLCKVNGRKALLEPSKSAYGQHGLFIEADEKAVTPPDLALAAGASGSAAAGGQRGLFEAESKDMALSAGGSEEECNVNISDKLPDVVMMSCATNLGSGDQGELSEGECKNPPAPEPGSAGVAGSSNAKSPQYVADYARLTPGENGDAHDSFSGTITINNQSIILTIENGVLTLAAPPEGYAYKEDGMLSLKEHLGMKEHEDFVLLNYDGGTKSIGKISSAAGADREERSAGQANSDSEMTLDDQCVFPELPGSVLDCCPSVKQEEAGLCDVEEASALGHCPKDSTVGLHAGCDDEMQPMGLGGPGLAKKGALVTYRCPHSGCSDVFGSRQKLKMHLVFHTEDQRPFKCTVEGCGWSFTTSYKLKRHLQSHDKVRPYKCEWENCGRRFTTVYNLKAHVKAHDQEDAFVCDICSERFRSATRLANHQRTHFEPERPHKCEFPGCEKAFITFSALFSHNRTHFRETGQFTCTYPGCDKRYDKACRLKIHLRSHTGERPFVCDWESCGWTFTSMSKLLRHKRKHDDDRRFMCPEEGCGKSFTRAEHLKGHSITHLGTKPFECRVEGCNAKFSARSSLYIHSKKHRQDGVCLRSRCPVAGCTKHFSSRSSLKSHMLKHHNLSADVLSQLESTATLTPSCELTSAAQTATTPGSVGAELSSLDLSSLLSTVPSGAPAASGGPSAPSGPAFTMDMSLVGAGILTIDPTSVSSSLGGAKTVDPLILAAGADMGAHVLDAGLGPGAGGGVLQQATLHLDDVQTVNPEAIGALTALAIQSTSSAEQLQALSSSSALTAESPSSSLTPSLTPSLSSSLSSSLAPSLASSLIPSLASSTALAGPPVPELLSPQPKADMGGSEAAVGPLISGVEVLSQPENSKGMSQFVFPSHSAAYGGQKESELPSVTTCSFLESSGSARTDYRAIQLAKRRKQKGPAGNASTSGASQRKAKGAKGSSAAGALASTSGRFGEGAAATTGGLTIRDPVTGAQYVQIQLLQDDPATDGDLAFQLSSQTSSSHSQLTVDLPVNILQEPSAMTEDDNGSDNSQFTGSTINLQDLE